MEDQFNFDATAIAANAKREQFLKEALEYRQLRAVIEPRNRKAPPDGGNAAGQMICCGRVIEI